MNKLRTGPLNEFWECEPIPNSSIFVLEDTVAPCCFRSLTTVASKGEMWFERFLDAAVVGSEEVTMLSFIAIASPLRGPELS